MKRYLLFALTLTLSICAGAKEARPNIIFILTDDQRYDAMGFMNHFQWLETPNIDRIRNEGVHFANAFTTHSLCGPSRAGFLTGMHSHKNGITTNQEGREIYHDQTPTFGKLLQRSGYQTAFIGKWHLGEYDDPRPGWNHWCSFQGQGNYNTNLLNIDGRRIVKEGYVSDVLTDYAIDFINRDHAEPFLLYLSHKAVHGPFTPPERHKDLYEGLPAPEPLSWMDDMDDKPEWQRRMILPWEQSVRLRRKNPVPVPAKRGLGKFPAETGVHLQRDYLRCIPAVDDGIGRIFQALEKLGKLDNTVIVFAGDNGYMHGEHGQGDKRQAYNESMRIPLIMRGPGIPAGGTVEEMVLNLDIAPTFLEQGGLKTPEDMQGRSLVQLAKGEAVADWRTSFLYTYWRDLVTAIPRITAVRTMDAMFADYPDGDSIQELYDLSKDPGEMKNLASLPESKPLKEKMEKELEHVMAEAGYKAVVKRPHPEDLNGRPLGVLLDKTFDGDREKTLPMSEELDPHYGCLVYECSVTPKSDGVILSYGDRVSGYMFYVQNGIPGFCFSSGQRFHALDGDVSCLNKPTHLLVEMDNYNATAKFYVNGKLVQTETIYCNLRVWGKNSGDIVLGTDPAPLVDPYELSKLDGFSGTIHSLKIQRERMADQALQDYALKAAKDLFDRLN